MANIITRETAGTGATVNGAPLSNAQVDNNFININNEVIGITQARYRPDVGTLNNLAVTFTPAWTSYTAGATIRVKPAFANTGAATLNVNSLGALAIQDPAGNALAGGELSTTVSVDLYCTGTTFRLLNWPTGKITTNILEIRPPSATNVLIKNTSTGVLQLGTNSNIGVTINANGTTTVNSLICTNSPTIPTATTTDASTLGANTLFVSARIAYDRPYEGTPSNIQMNGTQAVGSLGSVARGDHVHPTDTSRQAALGFTPLNKAGDTLSAGALKSFATVGVVGVDANNEQGFVVRSSGANAAHMTFVRDSIYGLKLGLDTDNKLKIGGYTMGAVSYELIHAGNIASYSAFAAGTRLAFAQTAAPSGWTQATGDWENNRLLRVVNTNTGSVGGSHDPTYCNVVAAHTHGVTVGNNSADHTHSWSTTSSGSHSHSYSYIGSTPSGGVFGSGTVAATSSNTGASTHSHSGTTGTQSAVHSHAASTDNGSSSTNWTPRYIDLIICSKN